MGFALTRCVYALHHESSRSVVSGSEGRHKGRVNTFLKWKASLFGAAQAPGLKRSEVKRGRASNSLLTRGHTHGSETEVIQPFKPRIPYASFPE